MRPGIACHTGNYMSVRLARMAIAFALLGAWHNASAEVQSIEYENSLIAQCATKLSEVHPWRASQIRRGIMRLHLASAPARAGNLDRLSPQDRYSIDFERLLAADLLAQTCEVGPYADATASVSVANNSYIREPVGR